MNWTLGVLSCIFGCFSILLTWSALLAGSFCDFGFWLAWSSLVCLLDCLFLFFHSKLDWRALQPDSRAHWRRLLVYYPRQFVFGASFNLTVAPILWGTRFSLFWASWAWSMCLVLFFRLLECSGALFDWVWPLSFRCLLVSIDFTF